MPGYRPQINGTAKKGRRGPRSLQSTNFDQEKNGQYTERHTIRGNRVTRHTQTKTVAHKNQRPQNARHTAERRLDTAGGLPDKRQLHGHRWRLSIIIVNDIDKYQAAFESRTDKLKFFSFIDCEGIMMYSFNQLPLSQCEDIIHHTIPYVNMSY